MNNLLLTHWFFAEINAPQNDQLFAGASAVVLLDFAAAHRVPAHLMVPVRFTGPLARRFSQDQWQARQQLGLEQDSTVTVITFGSIRPDKLPEIRTMLHTALAAWSIYGGNEDRLLVLAEPNERLGITHISHGKSVQWVGVTKMPELYFAAADLVIAYATFTTLSDLARNEIPAIAVIGMQNPVDRLHAKYFESMGLIQACNIDVKPDRLWHLGQEAMKRRKLGQLNSSSLAWADSRSIARLILSYLPGDGLGQVQGLL